MVPTCLLFSGSALLLVRRRTTASFLQLLGTACLIVVVLTHVAEALHWFPVMDWGDRESLGHYLDLSSAALGVTLFPVGYFVQALRS